MSLGKQITHLLTSNEGLSDREITDLLRGREAPQQPINQICRNLQRRGIVIRRKRQDGLLGNYLTTSSLEVVKSKTTVKYRRQNTKLESLGAEFLVLGQLLINGISSYKSYVNFPGYDLVAINPESGKIARIQVKSRWAINYDGSFPIKNFECDFVVHVALNRGYSFGKRTPAGESNVKSPEFYIFPIANILPARNLKSSWGKVNIRKISDFGIYSNRWDLIREFIS
jgi:hypothetical protein